ncbi:hypothetical protein Trydic_g12008, partial [Trypoxylus dichotomus]
MVKLVLEQSGGDSSMQVLFARCPAKKPLLSKKNRQSRFSVTSTSSTYLDMIVYVCSTAKHGGANTMVWGCLDNDLIAKLLESMPRKSTE